MEDNLDALNVSGFWHIKRKISTILSLHSNTRTVRLLNGFNKKHFPIRGTWRHLITQFRVPNGNNFPKNEESVIN
jgi:hypothetical protein